MKIPVLALWLLIFGACVAARADTVQFKNGDKLSGSFRNVRDGKLNLRSEVLGEVAIPLDSVESFSSAGPAVVITADQMTVRGQVSLQPSGEWQVQQDGASQLLRPAMVKVVMPQQEYRRLVEEPAKPWQDWRGSANAGYSQQNGDQRTHTLTGVVSATRQRRPDLLFMPDWRTTFGMTMLFSKAQQDGSSVTSNTISASLRQDYLFSPQNFIYVRAQLDHVDAQGLYLQQTYGGGFGRDVFNSPRLLLSFLGGVNYVREHYVSIPRSSSINMLLGEKVASQLNSRLRFEQHFNFYPDLGHRGRYRWDASGSLVLRLNSHLTGNIGVIDFYLSNPAPGSHMNNIAYTTGLGYTFGH